MKALQLSVAVATAFFSVTAFAADGGTGEIPEYPAAVSNSTLGYDVVQNGPYYRPYIDSAIGEAAYYPGPSFMIATDRYRLSTYDASGEVPWYPLGIQVEPVSSSLAMTAR